MVIVLIPIFLKIFSKGKNSPKGTRLTLLYEFIKFKSWSKAENELKYFNVDGVVRHGFSRWYLFTQWLKGTYRTLMRDKTWDAFADHSMGEYYNLCKQQLIEEKLDV